MSESCESSLPETSFVQFFPVSSPDAAVRRWESAPRSLPIKHSFAAVAFLFGYLAAYIGAGFAAVMLLERAWSAIFN